MFPLKPKKILKQQSSSSMIQYNGQVGTQCQNIQTQSGCSTALYYLNSKQKIEEKEDSVEAGTEYEHERAKDYLTQ
jgi:hypothetical protein